MGSCSFRSCTHPVSPHLRTVATTATQVYITYTCTERCSMVHRETMYRQQKDTFLPSMWGSLPSLKELGTPVYYRTTALYCFGGCGMNVISVCGSWRACACSRSQHFTLQPCPFVKCWQHRHLDPIHKENSQCISWKPLLCSAAVEKLLPCDSKPTAPRQWCLQGQGSSAEALSNLSLQECETGFILAQPSQRRKEPCNHGCFIAQHREVQHS